MESHLTNSHLLSECGPIVSLKEIFAHVPVKGRSYRSVVEGLILGIKGKLDRKITLDRLELKMDLKCRRSVATSEKYNCSNSLKMERSKT